MLYQKLSHLVMWLKKKEQKNPFKNKNMEHSFHCTFIFHYHRVINAVAVLVSTVSHRFLRSSSSISCLLLSRARVNTSACCKTAQFHQVSMKETDRSSFLSYDQSRSEVTSLGVTWRHLESSTLILWYGFYNFQRIFTRLSIFIYQLREHWQVEFFL